MRNPSRSRSKLKTGPGAKFQSLANLSVKPESPGVRENSLKYQSLSNIRRSLSRSRMEILRKEVQVFLNFCLVLNSTFPGNLKENLNNFTKLSMSLFPDQNLGNRTYKQTNRQTNIFNYVNINIVGPIKLWSL